MGSKKDKQALNAYQTAALLGAYGQGFATPDSGYGRTAAALTDSAKGAVAAQANYMAQKKAAKQRGTGGLGSSIGTALGVGAGLLLAPETGGASLLAAGALGGVVDAATSGNPAAAAQAVSSGATNVMGAASAYQKSAGANPYKDFDNSGNDVNALNTPQSRYTGEQGLASPGDAAKSLSDTPTVNTPVTPGTVSAPAAATPTTPAVTATPSAATPAATPAASAPSGNWVAPAIGTAAALGGAALYNRYGGPAVPKTPGLVTDGGQKLPGGLNPYAMPGDVSKMEPFTQSQWARENIGKMTIRQWIALDPDVRRTVPRPEGALGMGGRPAAAPVASDSTGRFSVSVGG